MHSQCSRLITYNYEIIGIIGMNYYISLLRNIFYKVIIKIASASVLIKYREKSSYQNHEKWNGNYKFDT